MSLHESGGQLADATKVLLAKWRLVRGEWDDAQARRVEEELMAPLEREVRQAASAMENARVALGSVKKDCEG